MTFKLLQGIRSRSRESWQQLALDRWTDSRIWIQENGELAAVLALLTGIIMTLAFKLFVTVLVLCLVLVIGAWAYALPESQMAGKKSASINGHGNKSPTGGEPLQ